MKPLFLFGLAVDQAIDRPIDRAIDRAINVAGDRTIDPLMSWWGIAKRIENKINKYIYIYIYPTSPLG